jgi:hypothetical protein
VRHSDSVSHDPADRVTLAGAITGNYIVEERLNDGRLVLRPDTGVDAIIERTGGGRPLTTEAFEQHFGHLPTDDGG